MNKKIDDIIFSCCIETRKGVVHMTLYNEDYFKRDLDDHDIIYKVNNDDFRKQFKKLKNIKGDYNNTYIPKYFKTEDECLIYMKSIGINSVSEQPQVNRK